MSGPSNRGLSPSPPCAKLVPGTIFYPFEIQARPQKLVPGTNSQPFDFEAGDSRAKKTVPGTNFAVPGTGLGAAR
jgi:hypothetical protein